MPSRLRLLDFRTSRAAAAVGICQGNIDEVAALANTCQRRLVFAREAGDTGWYGSWAQMAFTVSRTDPYITTPRGVARLERLSVCQKPTRIQNQFYEFLDFGIGPQQSGQPCHQELQVYNRNNAVTFVDLNPVNKTIQVYVTNAADVGKRVLLQGLDANGDEIYSQDGLINVTGIFLDLAAPFVTCPTGISVLQGIQKDITNGPVKFYEVDLTTGDLVLLLTMEPGEQTANYRRYYFGGLPLNCCPDPTSTTATVQITALAKLELIDAVVDTDWLLIQSLEALIEEAQAVRFSQIDNTEAQQMALLKHAQAIRYLQGELVHREGKDRPAVTFAPFGSARTRRMKIGTLT